jgi:hypothetical protein
MRKGAERSLSLRSSILNIPRWAKAYGNAADGLERIDRLADCLSGVAVGVIDDAAALTGLHSMPISKLMVVCQVVTS